MARKTTATPLDQEAQDELIEFAEALVDAEFHIWAIGKNKLALREEGETDALDREFLTARALKQIKNGQATGVAMRVGIQGATQTEDGKLRIPLVFEREGKASSAFRERLNAVAAETHADEVIRKLSRGCVDDSPSGGRHWYFDIVVEDEAEFDALMKRVVPAAYETFGEDAKGNPLNEIVAEFRTNGYIITAPSYGAVHPTGRPYEAVNGNLADIPTLTSDEVVLLGRALYEASDEKTLSRVAGTRVQLHCPAAARGVRSAYNATATDEDALQLLLDAGFTRNRGDLESHGYVELTRPSSDGSATPRSVVVGRERKIIDSDYLPGGAFVFTSGYPALPPGYHTPFDLYARLVHDAKANKAARHLLKEGLIDTSLIPTDDLAVTDAEDLFFDPEPIDVNSPEHGSTHALGKYISRKLAAQPSPRDGLPYVFRRAAGTDAPDCLLTVPQRGTAPRMWSHATREFNNEILRVVQPAKFKLDDNGNVYTARLENGVPETLAMGAYTEALADENIPVVEMLLSEPSLVRDRNRELRIVQTDGYDHDTRVLLTLDEEAWQDYAVNPSPSHEEAQNALDYLTNEILHDFYFASDGDYARMVAYLLTCVARPALPTVPAFGADAPDRDSGKSGLMETGRVLSVGSGKYQSIKASIRADEETEKRLVTAVLSGQRFAHTDELARGQKIDSKVLTELLTAKDGAFTGRVLGGTKEIALTGLIYTVSGNNIQAGGDINRRLFVTRLAPAAVAQSAHRKTGLRHEDLPVWIAANRSSLLAAAHTVLLYGAQNEPQETYRVGSFQQWSNLVLGSLSHFTLNEDDHRSLADLVMEGRQQWMEEQEDDALTDYADLVRWMHEKYDGAAVKASQVRDDLKAQRRTGSAISLPAHLAAEEYNESAAKYGFRFRDTMKAVLGTAIIIKGKTYRVSTVKLGGNQTGYRVTRADEDMEMPTRRTRAPRGEFRPEAPARRTATVSQGEEVAL